MANSGGGKILLTANVGLGDVNNPFAPLANVRGENNSSAERTIRFPMKGIIFRKQFVVILQRLQKFKKNMLNYLAVK